jgi:ubiquinone/menaquinone biosynthesis C-methylase UbiE
LGNGVLSILIRFIRKTLQALLGLALSFVVLHTLVRIVRRFYKFPIPHFLVGLIDNPMRRRAMPPELLAERHGLQPGQVVLEIGPGNGHYTLAVARRITPAGELVALDIQPQVIKSLNQRLRQAGVKNVAAHLGDVFNLPFDAETFDAIYLITVIGEIPTPEHAISEFYRVLKPGGTLAFSEALLDPDYPLASTLVKMATASGLRPKQKWGGSFIYTLDFEK